MEQNTNHGRVFRPSGRYGHSNASKPHRPDNLLIDHIDTKIINALLRNSRLSYRQLGKEVGVSAATAMSRAKQLEKHGIIRKYTIELDYEKLGFDVPVLIHIRVAKGKLFNVENKIASNPNVYAIYDKTGSFDATIVARFRNRKSMDSFLKKIQAYDFIERTETELILNTIKEEGIML